MDAAYRRTGLEEDERRRAMLLFDSQRGKFIIGQALYLALQKLGETPEQFQEKSNMADMRLLQKIFFPYEIVVQAQEKMRHGE